MADNGKHLFDVFLYIGLSIRLQRQKCKIIETLFSQPLIKRGDFFSVHIPLIYDVYYINIWYISLSFRLQKANI